MLYAGKVWVSESVPVWAPQLSGHLAPTYNNNIE